MGAFFSEDEKSNFNECSYCFEEALRKLCVSVKTRRVEQLNQP